MGDGKYGASVEKPTLRESLASKGLEFVTVAVMFGGILYSSTTAWQANRRFDLLAENAKEQRDDFEEQLHKHNDSVVAVKKTLVDILVKLGETDKIKTLLGETDKLKQENSLVEAMVTAGSFNTFTAALKAADLVDTLDGNGPYTIFAPTDEAFAKLPKDVLEDLLKPENKGKLAAILSYHVVPGNIMAADVAKHSSSKTVQGSDLSIHIKDGKLTVGNARIVRTDIKCSNGVIHVIDEVMLPSG
jgi:uncharacterized surface protein with fasciclin (FAS1) repeats